MPGVTGSGGPVPKRSNQRHGHRSKADKASTEQAPTGPEVQAPEADESWHPVARRWYESLSTSGQSRFYEPSDWATACVIAESISRELKPQPMVVGSGQDATVEFVEQSPKGASLAAWLKGMTVLLVTEGDRRRLRLELTRTSPEGGADVSELDDARAARIARLSS